MYGCTGTVEWIGKNRYKDGSAGFIYGVVEFKIAKGIKSALVRDKFDGFARDAYGDPSPSKSTDLIAVKPKEVLCSLTK